MKHVFVILELSENIKSMQSCPIRKKKMFLSSPELRDSSLIHASGKGAQEGESRLRWVLEGFRQVFFKKDVVGRKYMDI